MITTDTVKAKLRRLLGEMNATTGFSHADLFSAFNKMKEGVGGGDQPRLNAPSIWINSYNATLSIGDTLNSNFVTGYNIYVNDTYFATVTERNINLLELMTFVEDVTFKVTAIGDNFKESEYDSVIWTRPILYTPTVTIDNPNDTIVITNTNGEKTKCFEIYANGELLTTTTETTVVLTDYMDLEETQAITVKALSWDSYYLDSEESDVVYWLVKTEGTPGLNYSLSSDGTYYICKGIGTAAVTDIIIASYINGIPVTRIDTSAFSDCSNITSIVIPDSITSIGMKAFYYCTALVKIYFNAISVNDFTSNNHVFQRCGRSGNGIRVVIGKRVTKIPNYIFYPEASSSDHIYPAIVSVEFEEGSVCKSIGEHAFGRCEMLERIDIPDSLENIGRSAFYECTSLTYVNISNIATWCSLSFEEGYTPLGYSRSLYLNGELLTELVIPDGVASIGRNAFAYNESLVSVTIPGSVTSIEYGAFKGNINITSVTIGDGVTSIENSVFAGCKSLISITIPDSVTDINGMNTFDYCSSLTSVTIGNGISYLPYSLFLTCDNLTDIYVPWSEGEVANAPWGATNATIHYNSEV